MNRNIILLVLIALMFNSIQAAPAEIRIRPVAKGWAGTSDNAVVFRRNSVVTHKGIQYVAFYDSSGSVVLAKRRLP